MINRRNSTNCKPEIFLDLGFYFIKMQKNYIENYILLYLKSITTLKGRLIGPTLVFFLKSITYIIFLIKYDVCNI